MVRYALLKGVYFKTNEAFIFLTVLLKKQGYLRPCEYKAGQKKVLRHVLGSCFTDAVVCDGLCSVSQ